jgi:DNA-directed RNA polymerase specialized sigma24 family protein
MAMAGRDDVEFQQLFETLYRQCHALGRRLMGSDERAETVATEAMARAYARWSKVRALAHPEGWALLTTARLAAETLAEDRSGAPAIGLSVLSLEPDVRDVIVLRYLTSLDEDEVGLVLGLAPETVQGRIAEGLAELRARGTWSAGVSAA